MQFTLTERNRALLLASLRFFQDNLEDGLEEFADTATNLGQFPKPEDSDIDNLCALLNGSYRDEEPDFEAFSVPVPSDPDYFDPLVEHGR